MQEIELADMTGDVVRLHEARAQPDGRNDVVGSVASPTDVELMARLAKEDADALAILYDRHAAAVFGLVRAILRDPRVAEEATHDVFLGLWGHPERYEPTRGPFVGWLLRVSRNRAIDLLRRDREQPFTSAPPADEGHSTDPTSRLVDPDPDPAEQALRLVQREDVRKAMMELTIDQQRLLGLAYFDGLTQREIAIRIDRPLGTVKTQIRTAMQRLAGILEAADPSLRGGRQARPAMEAPSMPERDVSAATDDGGATAKR